MIHPLSRVLAIPLLGSLLSCRPAPEPPDRAGAADSPATVATPADTAAAGDCLPLWPKKVVLSGVFRSEERQGPPNYGETPEQDMDLTIYLVDLDPPRDVCGSRAIPNHPRGPVAGVSTIQLVGSRRGSESWLEEAVGRRIEVHGELEHAVYGAHYYPVVMRVDSATPGW